jgi:oxalate decarboxylase
VGFLLDSGVYPEALLSDWIAKVPRQLLANNLGLPERAFANLNQRRSWIIAV